MMQVQSLAGMLCATAYSVHADSRMPGGDHILCALLMASLKLSSCRAVIQKLHLPACVRLPAQA